MFCPQCGNEIHEDESYFCPYCGQNLSPSNSTSLETERPKSSSRLSPEGGRPKKIIAALGVFAILILASALVVIYDRGGEESPESQINSSPSDSAIINGDGSYIELDGGFSDGSMFSYRDADGRLIIYLDSSLKQKYPYFVWILRDNISETYSVSPKNEGEMIWSNPCPGTYEVTVHCYDSRSDSDYAESYTGIIEYHGDMTKNYVWIFDGKLFSISASISVDEYVESSSKKAADSTVRHSDRPEDIMGFISADGIVSNIETSLGNAYYRVYGAPQNGDQRYAEFILSFVQSNIGFSYDSVNYGCNTYNAFPIETLYRGTGDSDDSAILCASLFSKAGYETGLVHLPDKTMAAVSLKYSDDHDDIKGYHSLQINNGGKTFVVADTAPSVGSVPLGYISDYYGYNPITKTFQYFGQDCDRSYGLYV